MPKFEVIRALTGHASALDATCVRLAASYQPWRPPTRIPFWKMHGGGNDFVVIDNRQELIPGDAIAEFTRAARDNAPAFLSDLVDRP